MSKILPIMFVLILAVVVGGLDFFIQKKKFAGQEFGLTEYIGARKAALANYSKPPSLANALPDQLPGWDVHPFMAEDIALIKGRAPTQKEAEQFIDIKGQENFGMLMTKGVNKVDLAMYKGDAGIRLTGILLSSEGGMATQALQAQNAFMKAIAETEELAPPRDFAMVDGVLFQELSPGENDDPAVRVFTATLTNAITVSAATRSTDDAMIAEALGAVDFVMLNNLLKQPLPNIAESVVAMAGDEPEVPNQPEAVPVETAAEPAPATAVQSGTKIEKGTKPKIVSKGCVRRAGVLDCPKS